MVRAKKYETESKFVKVMPRNTVTSSFQDTVYISAIIIIIIIIIVYHLLIVLLSQLTYGGDRQRG